MVASIVETLNSLGRAFVGFAWPMLIQSGVLITIMLLVDLAIRRRVRAVVRYWLWMLVMVKLVLPTSLSLPTGVGYWVDVDKPIVQTEIEETRRASSSAKWEEAEKEYTPIQAAMPSQEMTAEAPKIVAEEKEIAPAVHAQVPADPIDWRAMVFLGWLAVAVGMTLLVGQRYLFVRGLIRQASTAEGKIVEIYDACCRQMGISRKPALKLSPAMVSPAACGLARPVVLVPELMATKLSEKELRSVLLHELAHIRRGDLWVNCAQTVLQVAYFYNPLLWLANGIIRRIREQAVDETVLVTLSENAAEYPETLVNVAELALARPALSLRMVGVVESKSALAGRIKHMLSHPWPKSAKLGGMGLTGILVIAALLLPMAKGEEKTVGDAHPTAETASTQKSDGAFKATFSNGVTAELVGVSEYPSKGKQWWRADGSKLDQPPYDNMSDYSFHPGEKDKVLEIVLRRIDTVEAKDANFQWKMIFTQGGTASGGIPPLDKEGQSIDDLVTMGIVIPKQQNTIAMRYGMAAGEWKTFAKHSGDGTSGHATAEGSVSFAEPYENENGTGIVVSNDLKDMDNRMIAIDREGNTHIARQSSGCGANNVNLTTYQFSNLRKQQIKEFQFQTRPYEWIDFKNVSLEPGVKTAVEIIGDGGVKQMVGGTHPTATVSSPPAGITYRQLHFVRLVVGKDQMTFEGQKVDPNVDLVNYFTNVKDRPNTVLEYAVDNDKLTLAEFQKIESNIFDAAKGCGNDFAYLSYVGVHPLGSKGSPIKSIAVSPFVFDKLIPVHLSSNRGASSGPRHADNNQGGVFVKDIRFSKKQDHFVAEISLLVSSWPKAEWEIQLRLLDKANKAFHETWTHITTTGWNTPEPYLKETTGTFDSLPTDIVSRTSTFEIRLSRKDTGDSAPKESTQAGPTDHATDNSKKMVGDAHPTAEADEASAETQEIVSKVARIDIGRANQKDVIKVFGKPEAYMWGQKELDEKNLPATYVMNYPDGFQVLVSSGHVEELRFEEPGPFVHPNGLRVGSTMDEAVEILGEPGRIVQGEANQFEDGVLYKTINGKKGMGYYARSDKGVRMFFVNDEVKALYLTGSIKLQESQMSENITIPENPTTQPPASEIRIPEPEAEPIVKGLELQLRADKISCPMGENPSLWLDTRNAGTDAKPIKWSADGFILLVDGEEFVYGVEKNSPTTTLQPGENIKNLHIIPSRYWRNALDNTPLSLTIGNHTIQLMVKDDNACKSNTVTIDISEKSSPPSARNKPETKPLPVGDEIIVEDKTIYPGLGLQNIHVGDSLAKLKEQLGQPTRERSFANGGLSVEYQHGTLNFVVGDQIIREIHFNEGYTGSLSNGIRLGSGLDDVVKLSGGASNTVETPRKRAHGVPGNRVLYKVKADSGNAIIAYKFVDEKQGILYWFDQNKNVSQIVVYRPQNTASEEPPSSTTYIIQFKAGGNQRAILADDLLKLFNDQPPLQVGTHHFRTEIDNDELVGYICADTLLSGNQLKTALCKNKKIQIVGIRKASSSRLQKIYAMGQPSLDPEKLTETPTSSAATSQPVSSVEEDSIDKKYITQETQLTVRSAIKWVKLIDDGKYAESWDESAEFFRKAMPKEKWGQSVGPIRESLGKKLSRKVIAKEYTTTVPGAPNGEYVVIQFATSFENKKDAIETITPMKDKDGSWRVSGYYIK